MVVVVRNVVGRTINSSSRRNIIKKNTSATITWHPFLVVNDFFYFGDEWIVFSTTAFVQTLMESLHPCPCKTQFIFFYWLNSLNRQICCLPRTWSTFYVEKLMRMFYDWPTILKCKFLERPTILTPDFSFRKKRKIVRSVKLGQLRHAARLAGWDLQPEILCSFIYPFSSFWCLSSYILIDWHYWCYQTLVAVAFCQARVRSKVSCWW